MWIYNNIRGRGTEPEANAVALIVMLLSMIPVYIAQRLAGTGALRRRRVAAGAAAAETGGRDR